MVDSLNFFSPKNLKTMNIHQKRVFEFFIFFRTMIVNHMNRNDNCWRSVPVSYNRPTPVVQTYLDQRRMVGI